MILGTTKSLLISFALMLFCFSSVSWGQDLEERVATLEGKVEKLEQVRQKACLNRVDGFIPEGTFIFSNGERKRQMDSTYEVQVEKKYDTSYTCSSGKAVAKVFAPGKTPECFHVVACSSDLVLY